MRFVTVPLAVAAALALAAPALAADPVPGAHYEGTTDTGSPFSFDVSPDGTKITNVVTSAPLTCVGPEGGVEIYGLASKGAFDVAGGTISGKDGDASPRLEMKGVFETAQSAKGTLDAATSKFKLGEGVTSCMRTVEFTARTSAGAPPAKTDDNPSPSDVSPGPVQTVVTIAGAKTRKLSAVLRSGLALPLRLDGPATVTGTATLAARDARRFGVKRTLATATATRAAAGALTLTLKPGAAVARKLRRARRLVVTVTVSTGGNVAAPTITRRTLTLS